METIDARATSIASLTKALRGMTVTCKTLTATNSPLVAALVKCGGATGTNPPPGFSQIGTTTGYALDIAGVTCPTHKKKPNSIRMTSVTGQYCATCRRTDRGTCPTTASNFRRMWQERRRYTRHVWQVSRLKQQRGEKYDGTHQLEGNFCFIKDGKSAAQDFSGQRRQ